MILIIRDYLTRHLHIFTVIFDDMPIHLLNVLYIFNELRTLGRQYLYMGLMAASAELASIQHLRRVIWQLPTQIANDF